MPTVTVEGEKSFEVEAGKKLVLAIEDAGIDILHRCGGNARCTTCRVQGVSGELEPMGGLGQTRPRARGEPGPGYPPVLPGPRRVRPDHQGAWPGLDLGDARRPTPGRLIERANK